MTRPPSVFYLILLMLSIRKNSDFGRPIHKKANKLFLQHTSFLIRFGNESVKNATSRRANFNVLSRSFMFALISFSSLLNSNFRSSKYSIANCPISVAPIRHLPWARQSSFRASRTTVKYDESWQNSDILLKNTLVYFSKIVTFVLIKYCIIII